MMENIPVEYITFRRFKTKGIDGEFNLSYGTIVMKRAGMLYAPDGRCICAATSENGWNHFRPNTSEGAHRQRMLDRLFCYYALHPNSEDFAPRMWERATNLYWKNLLRTMPTNKLETLYKTRCENVRD